MVSSDDYIKEKQSIDILKANKFGIRLLLTISVISIVLFYLFWHASFIERLKGLVDVDGLADVFWGILLVLGILFGGIILHELIHGLFWAMFTKNGFRSIKFGILRQYITPYCHSKEPLRVWQYIVGAIMPAIFLGIVPLFLALVYGSLHWLFFGIFFTAAAGGDFLMIKLLLKEKMNDRVQDHPSEAGFYMFREKTD